MDCVIHAMKHMNLLFTNHACSTVRTIAFGDWFFHFFPVSFSSKTVMVVAMHHRRPRPPWPASFCRHHCRCRCCCRLAVLLPYYKYSNFHRPPGGVSVYLRMKRETVGEGRCCGCSKQQLLLSTLSCCHLCYNIRNNK